ncbi:hypothetical protein JR316_0006799 [Psilocybe cubensis]|uniref:Uncharacterized protein n=1 Tax=Psilocybe cubensis TaxID=181762 RepID=A0ACB8GX45_PSICU|nr:hypothetical protein JR316_0006799 [Psilocybe cubensis]KAH9480201.1 hypothetical protein JR316_0006799 [Psilocybe cubensis]
MQFTTFFTALLAATASVVAAPTPTPTPTPLKSPQELIVFNPPITSPKSSSAWAKGSEQIVEWEITNIPESRVNSTGTIVLGYSASENGNEHLDIAHPLATDFPIKQGFMKVVMPKNIAERNDYFIVRK